VKARIFGEFPVVFCQGDLFVAAFAQQVFRAVGQLFFAPAAELFQWYLCTAAE
jgi:hypothetical protein